MARNSQGGRGSGNRGGKNNNPQGHNQYSGGWMDTAKDKPIATAAVAAAAVGAGVFLWSRRNQISEQISGLSDQISEWRDGMQSDDDMSTDAAGTSEPFMAKPARRGGRKSQAELSEEALTLKETGSA